MTREPYRLLDLFSGIGGFSLGLERSGGFRTVAFCEIEPYCRRVLAKHWPGVPCYDDIRTLTAERLAADGIGVDAICGGFPCQDISFAGKGAGLEGERSGLWFEYARIIGELRPRYVIVENVAALLGRGLDRVLADLAALGFDAVWHCVPASAIGAPHRRDRLWLVANASRRRRCRPSSGEVEQPGRAEAVGTSETMADTPRERCGKAWELRPDEPSEWPARRRQTVANADSERFPVPRPIALGTDWLESGRVSAASRWWSVEPDVGRVVAGVPSRVDRLRALGNAVVPQIPELIGRAILSAEDAA